MKQFWFLIAFVVWAATLFNVYIWMVSPALMTALLKWQVFFYLMILPGFVALWHVNKPVKEAK